MITMQQVEDAILSHPGALTVDAQL
jgi:hypothetical protein